MVSGKKIMLLLSQGKLKNNITARNFSGLSDFNDELFFG